MNFIWEGSDLGNQESIFTHVLYDHYYPHSFLRSGPDNCFVGDISNAIIKNCIETLYKYA